MARGQVEKWLLTRKLGLRDFLLAILEQEELEAICAS
jgi:hypothetical protein